MRNSMSCQFYGGVESRTDTFLPFPLASTAAACEAPTACVLGAVVDDRTQDVQPGPEVGTGGQSIYRRVAMAPAPQCQL